ncbi:MAG: hypothetical protein ABFS09_05930 [Thermodesulfobacteriota bacterium]
MSLLRSNIQKEGRRYPGLSAFYPLILAFFLLAGCQTTKVDTWKPVRSQHKNQVHTVTWTSETLPIISKWYTGTEMNWKKIANANPNILPGQLNQGDQIFIPSFLLKTRAAMTKYFLEEWLPAARQSKEISRLEKKGEPAPLLVPKLHKLKQDGNEPSAAGAPPDLQEPEDDGSDLELFGPK